MFCAKRKHLLGPKKKTYLSLRIEEKTKSFPDVSSKPQIFKGLVGKPSRRCSPGSMNPSLVLTCSFIVMVMHAFVHMVIHAFIILIIHSFIHMVMHLIHTVIHSFTHSHGQSFIHTVIYSCIHVLIHMVIHSFIYSCSWSFHKLVLCIIPGLSRSPMLAGRK